MTIPSTTGTLIELISLNFFSSLAVCYMAFTKLLASWRPRSWAESRQGVDEGGN
jgi:hypothetical protein